MIIPDYVDESHKILWPAFSNWCKNNEIGDTEIEHPDDIELHWNCFIAGATAMYLKIKLKEIDI